MLTREDLHDCANSAAEVAEVLTLKKNVNDETVTRGLYMVASALSALTAAAYEIAASLRKD